MAFQRFCDANERQITEYATKFNSYVYHVDEPQIRNWLRRFGENDLVNLNLGLKLLNKIEYYQPNRITNEARDLHRQLLAYKGVTIDQLLEGKTYFVNFSYSSGHSQDVLMHHYRLAAGLRHQRYDKYFIYLRDLANFVSVHGVETGLTLIFVTDFVGSGKQVCDIWKNTLWAINPENEHILLSLCGYDSGMQKIQTETDDVLCPITCRMYTNRNRFFHADNRDFTPDEKFILNRLCATAGQDPFGYLNVQASTVFYFRCPNDTISILRANNANWVGLFKRYEDETP